MKPVTLELPDGFANYILSQNIDKNTEFKRILFLLFVYIDSNLISFQKAASLLGIEESKLVSFFKKYGILCSHWQEQRMQLFERAGATFKT